MGRRRPRRWAFVIGPGSAPGCPSCVQSRLGALRTTGRGEWGGGAPRITCGRSSAWKSWGLEVRCVRRYRGGVGVGGGVAVARSAGASSWRTFLRAVFAMRGCVLCGRESGGVGVVCRCARGGCQDVAGWRAVGLRCVFGIARYHWVRRALALSVFQD